MKFSVPAYYDTKYIDVIKDEHLPVHGIYGSHAYTLTGSGRCGSILPKVSDKQFSDFVSYTRQNDIDFYYTYNSSELALKEYSNTFYNEFMSDVSKQIKSGVNGFSIAIPMLLDWIKREYPDVKVYVSSFARIRTVAMAQYWHKLGADTIYLEEANRDFGLIRALAREGYDLEVLVNESCIWDCPYRGWHFNTNSMGSQKDTIMKGYPLPMFYCGVEVLNDPLKWFTGEWIRPEDLEFYEKNGVKNFKLSGRNKSMDELLQLIRVYASRKFDGNLLDIIGSRRAYVPQQMSDGKLAEQFEVLATARIDNSLFPSDYIQQISRRECGRITCEKCGYCKSVADKVMTIGGKPLSEYQSPNAKVPIYVV